MFRLATLALGASLAAPASATTPRGVITRLSAGGEATPTWKVEECCLPFDIAAGGTAHFSVTWGVDAASSVPAAAAILSGSFWFGGLATNVTVAAPGKCELNKETQQLVCDLGPVAIGAWAPTVNFDVSALAAETAPHYLPYFLAGLNGFANGPETFGRVEVQ